jgi:hypothetical protein
MSSREIDAVSSMPRPASSSQIGTSWARKPARNSSTLPESTFRITPMVSMALLL